MDRGSQDLGDDGEGCSTRGSTEGAHPAVSVVIVSWNTRDMLLDTLASFLPLAGVDCELIVVDNASSDDSCEAVAARHPEARILRNERNEGFAAGVTRGLRAARHPWVLLLNPDTLVVDDAIPHLLAYAEAHPEAGIIGPRVLNRDGTLQHSRFRFPSLLNLLLQATYLYKLFPRSSFLARETLPEVGASEPAAVDAVSGCCFLVRQEVIERVGVLDEQYFMYFEETDLCRRCRDAGFEVHYAPVGEIVHFGGGASRLARRRNFLEFRRSALRYFRKHHGRAAAELARALLLAFLLVRIPLWAVASLRPGERGAAGRGQLANYCAGVRFLLTPLGRLLGGDAPRPTT